MRSSNVVLLMVGLAGCGPDVVDPQPAPAPLDLANRDSMTVRIELFVDDVARSVDFYTGVMGFQLDYGDTDYAVVHANSVRLGIGSVGGLPDDHYFQPELVSERRGLGAEIVFEVDDIENYFASVISTGATLEAPLTVRSWGATDFRIVDPDGYYLRPTSR